jgi:exodeoxyribonuclease V gamma subunit
MEPRDVIVMCPDIEQFAPLLEAVFGPAALAEGRAVESPPAIAAGPVTTAGGDGPGTDVETGLSSVPELRVRMADRSLRQTNPLLSLTNFLLELAGSRLTASQLLDLASREPVRRRFRFDDDELSQVEQWVVEMGVRWGFDGAHRTPWGVPEFEANTWMAGLDRLLLGVAMSEEGERLFEGTLPLDDVASGWVDLAGRLAELVDRVRTAVDGLTGRHPISGWRDAIASATESLAEVSPSAAWQRDQLHQVLDETVVEAAAIGRVRSPLLDLAEVRSLLGDRLKGRPTRANFRTGEMTVCTLVPMRSVPHRVVCLLGLDDGVFPRHTEQDGDDLLLGDPCVGDRDARSEDRQLLLDAVLAAGDHLVITFNGRDERTNHERPPAVPIAELLDVVDRTVRVGDGTGRAREAVTVRHPLQAFDLRNFTPGRLGGERPWSFDRLNLEGAQALSRPRGMRTTFLAEPLESRPEAVVQLSSLVRFVEHPVRAFLRERLGFYASPQADGVDDDLPIELDGLERWAVGDRLLSARLGGATADEAVLAEQARGMLPPGPLGAPVLAEVLLTVEALVDAVRGLPGAEVEPRSLEVNVRLPGGRAVIGTVAGVRAGTVVRCIYSSLAPKHRLATWVRFLAVSAAWPEIPVAAVTIGRGRKPGGRPQIQVSTFTPLAATADGRLAAAHAGLNLLVDLYDRGMCEPLPIYCATSAAWAEAGRAGIDPLDAARAAWMTDRFDQEDGEAEHLLVLGGRQPLEVLLEAGPRLDESGPGWQAAELTRFGRLACRLWDGPLDHEQQR